MKRFLFALLILLLPHLAIANPMHSRHSVEFKVPTGLRARVDFWIDIFTRFGKNDVVIHHREFPQIVFKILHFNDNASESNLVLLEKRRKKVLTAEIDEIKDAVRTLATGRSPRSSIEKMVERVLRPLPGGHRKYKQILDDDLIRGQTGIREKYEEAIVRSGRYLPMMEQIFREEGLPIELTRLPFIESSFNYQAYSSAGAAGIWQFMRSTGKIYLMINSTVDERRDPIESTRAAARYLKHLFSSLGTWPLAITSYNHGAAGVKRRTKKIGSTNIVTIIEHPSERVFGFASANFYPEFLAALEVYDSRTKYFPDISPDRPLQIDQIRITTPTSINTLLNRMNLDLEQLQDLNLGLSKAVWSGLSKVPAGYVLKVPDGYAVQVASAQTATDIEPRRVQKPQKVAVERVKVKTQQPEIRAKRPGRIYRVAKGDSLWSISKRFKVSVSEIKRANNMKGNSLRAGVSIVVPE